MQIKTTIRSFAYATLFLTCCSFSTLYCSIAQSKPQESSQGLKTRKPEERSVVVDALALDAHGRPLQNLSANNLLVRVDGKQIDPQAVQLGNGDGEQPQIILVLDAVNCSLAELTRSIDAVHTYLHLANGRLSHPTSIFIFADTNTQPRTSKGTENNGTSPTKELYAYRIPSSTDGLVLSHALDEFDPGLRRVRVAQERPAPPDQVSLSLRALDALADAETPVKGPKLVLWISPGWPYFTSTARSSEQVFGSVIYFSELLRSARIMLYCIDPRGLVSQDTSAAAEAFFLSSRPGFSNSGQRSSGRTQPGIDYYKSFIHPVRKPGDADPNDLLLEVLAISSGGAVIQNKNDLADEIAHCAEEADGHVQFSYTPDPSPAGTMFHSVSITVTGVDGSVRVRPGFYAR